MTPDERAAIRAEAFREAAEIARKLQDDATAEIPNSANAVAIMLTAQALAQAIEARAKEKQP